MNFSKNRTIKRILATISILIVGSLFVTGCGTIRSHRNIEQPMDSVLTTSVGGTFFRLNKTGDLPNAYGGRDIYGGKIDKGFAEMKLAGIEGKLLILEIIDINKQSSETVMDRYKPFQNRNSDLNIDVNNSVTIVNQERPKSYIVRFDTDKQRDIVISGVRVTFSEVQPYSVVYSLENVQP